MDDPMDGNAIISDDDEPMLNGDNNQLLNESVASPPSQQNGPASSVIRNDLLLRTPRRANAAAVGQNMFGASQTPRARRAGLSTSQSTRSFLLTPNMSRNRADGINFMSPMRYGDGSNLGTPNRLPVRHDLGSGMDLPPNAHARQLTTSDDPELYIWGTSVNINVVKNEFREFLQTYKPDEFDEDEKDSYSEWVNFQELAAEDEKDLSYYLQRFNQLEGEGIYGLPLDCRHLYKFNKDIYNQLIAYPQEVIPMFDLAATELYMETHPDNRLPGPIQVRPFRLRKMSVMRQMNPEDIDRLVSISGMVIRTSNLIPELRHVFFQCSVCDDRRHDEIVRGKINEPTHCQNCNSTHSFSIMHNLSRFSDVQIVKIQESQEDMPPGQTPHTIMVYAHDSLVDTVQAGDRIVVTGVFRTVPIRPNPRQQVIRSVYRTNVDVVHFEKKDKHKKTDELMEQSTLSFSEERIRQINELAQKPDVYERLSRALAPSIYGCDDIKKGVLLQLLGGSQKDFTKFGRGRPRCEINILLCGDPGTSKSQMLQYIHKVAPRGQYTSGKGSSAVGLTAYVTRDPDTRQFCLQSGALVLSDNGVCCIDEFDKMNESTRSVLHEVMEQQTLSIAKAGIICQLNARTSILAAANPIESQWNKDKTIIDNIQLPHTLLSRFDLIFLVLDPQDEAYDKQLARHLVSIYYRSEEAPTETENIEMELLKDYLAYTRAQCNPKLDEAAAVALVNAYVDMRRIGKGRGQISAYPRQLESLIRMAEARAKVHLGKMVLTSDVEEAIRLHREALKQAATDPTSGKIDVSILVTGMSNAARQRRQQLAGDLRDFLQTKLGPGTYPRTRVFDEFRGASKLSVTRDQFEDALKEVGEGVITFLDRNIRVS